MIPETTIKICISCKTPQPLHNYDLRKSNHHLRKSECKNCRKAQQAERARTIKQQCVDYLGGQCIRCGYNKSIKALDFHHRDPQNKSFGICQSSRKFDFLKEELDKCDLLCANCHREIT